MGPYTAAASVAVLMVLISFGMYMIGPKTDQKAETTSATAKPVNPVNQRVTQGKSVPRTRKEVDSPPDVAPKPAEVVEAKTQSVAPKPSELTEAVPHVATKDADKLKSPEPISRHNHPPTVEEVEESSPSSHSQQARGGSIAPRPPSRAEGSSPSSYSQQGLYSLNEHQYAKAIAVLQPTKDNPGVSGTVTFT